MGENVFRGGFRVGTTSSYSLPTIKGASGTTLIADSNGDLYWGTGSGGGTGLGLESTLALGNTIGAESINFGGFSNISANGTNIELKAEGNISGDLYLNSLTIKDDLINGIAQTSFSSISDVDKTSSFSLKPGNTYEAHSIIDIFGTNQTGVTQKHSFKTVELLTDQSTGVDTVYRRELGVNGTTNGSLVKVTDNDSSTETKIETSFNTITVKSKTYSTTEFNSKLILTPGNVDLSSEDVTGQHRTGISTADEYGSLDSTDTSTGNSASLGVFVNGFSYVAGSNMSATDGTTSYSSVIYVYPDNIIVNGNNPAFAGMEYDNNYSSYYTNRSLVDKEYVDTAVSSVGGGTSGGVIGSATSGQVTFWNGTTSIEGDSNLTYDSINNVLKIGGTSGGLFVDISGDATPLTFPINPFTSLYLNSEGKTSIYNPERMIGSAEGAAQDAANVLITSSNPTFPQNGIVGPNIAFSYSDDANTGNMSGVIGIVGAGGTGIGDEDGTLMVFGTRPNTSGGPFDPKEAIRIGRNQFVGVYYKPGATQSPPAMLTIGTNLANSNNIALRETNASLSAITDYGQFYINSTNKKPFFLSSGGTAYDLTTESLGAVMTVGSTASTDLNMNNYNINGVTTIKSANNTAQIQTINMINASLLNLMYNT